MRKTIAQMQAELRQVGDDFYLAEAERNEKLRDYQGARSRAENLKAAMDDLRHEIEEEEARLEELEALKKRVAELERQAEERGDNA